jgi:hypothetical protein
LHNNGVIKELPRAALGVAEETPTATRPAGAGFTVTTLPFDEAFIKPNGIITL